MVQNIQLEQDEHITLSSHRHWINLAPPIFSSIVLLIGAAVVAYLSGRYNNHLNGLSVPAGIIMIIVVLLVVFAGTLTALAFWVYRRNQLILTNKHLIKVEQDGLFARKVSQLGLSRVQDVNGSRKGLIPTILNFGNVEVQTAGEQEEFIFVQMPDPNGLANRLVKAHDEFADAEDGTGTAPTAPPPVSPLQSPAVSANPIVVTPLEPTPAPVAEEVQPAPTDLPPFEIPPEAEEATSTSDFGDHEEAPTPVPAPEPPVETPPAEPQPPAPAPLPTSNELTEHETVQILPPQPPAS